MMWDNASAPFQSRASLILSAAAFCVPISSAHAQDAPPPQDTVSLMGVSLVSVGYATKQTKRSTVSQEKYYR